MKAVMVMYDSLRLDMLPCYGAEQIPLPNFERLAARTVVFDNSYACSMPCMPARRELHTGRANFLHRSWGPIEPFDDSMPELLKQHGIYTRIVTDHNHYVEDGGATYCTRYSSWECNRGQEGDPWQGSAAPEFENPHCSPIPVPFRGNSHSENIKKMRWQDILNRRAHVSTADFPQAKTFAQGIDFLEKNHQNDNWYIQIETFDPHEPFDVPGEYLSKLFDPDRIGELDWPFYGPVTESKEDVFSIRAHYLALLAFCDDCLGKVLDQFDKYDLWKDTMLIVNTDHGYMLSEHGWWGKLAMLDYQEIMHTPLFIWDPRSRKKGERRVSLVQTIDLAPTLLDFFGVAIPKDMLGKSLGNVVANDEPVREYAIFGYRGGTLDITDGRYKLLVMPKEKAPQMFDYTLMPTHMSARFSVQEMQQAELVEPFSFTKGCRVLRIPISLWKVAGLNFGDEILFDLKNDPYENSPIYDEAITARLKAAMRDLLKQNDAPNETYACYGLQM